MFSFSFSRLDVKCSFSADLEIVFSCSSSTKLSSFRNMIFPQSETVFKNLLMNFKTVFQTYPKEKISLMILAKCLECLFQDMSGYINCFFLKVFPILTSQKFEILELLGNHVMVIKTSLVIEQLDVLFNKDFKLHYISPLRMRLEGGTKTLSHNETIQNILQCTISRLQTNKIPHKLKPKNSTIWVRVFSIHNVIASIIDIETWRKSVVAHSQKSLGLMGQLIRLCKWEECEKKYAISDNWNCSNNMLILKHSLKISENNLMFQFSVFILEREELWFARIILNDYCIHFNIICDWWITLWNVFCLSNWISLELTLNSIRWAPKKRPHNRQCIKKILFISVSRVFHEQWELLKKFILSNKFFHWFSLVYELWNFNGHTNTDLLDLHSIN